MFTHNVLKCCIGGGVRGVLISWRLSGGLSHRICTLHHVAAAALHPLLLRPPLHSAERYLPHLGSVATFSCLNVYKLNFVRLRTTGSARIRASPQVHLGLCPALPPLNAFVSPSAPWWRFSSGTTPPSICHLPFSSCLCISTGRSSGAQELRSYLLPPPPLGPDRKTCWCLLTKLFLACQNDSEVLKHVLQKGGRWYLINFNT